MCPRRAWLARILRLSAAGWITPKAWARARETTCEDNLRAIFEAIQRWRAERGGLPDSLSSLARTGLIDPRILICPAARAQGAQNLENPSLVNGVGQDPLTLYKWEWRAGIAADQKERQRLIGGGDWVPLVRCDYHEDGHGNNHLNLGFGGGIYPSPNIWEFCLRDRIPTTYLLSRHLLGKEGPVIPLRERFLPRSPAATARHADLSRAFNASLHDGWMDGSMLDPAQELHTLAPENRLWTHDGIGFEMRGVVQCEGRQALPFYQFGPHGLKEDDQRRFPETARAISWRVEADRIQLLCGIIYEAPHGTEVARVTLEDDTGATVVLALRYGEHVVHAPSMKASAAATLAWTRATAGTDPAALRSVSHVRWPLGQRRRIVALRFAATEAGTMPFLLAATAG
jgi:hypothetical protein